MSSQPFCELPAHASCGLAEAWFFTGSSHRHEQVLVRIERIDVIEIRIDEDEIPIYLAELSDFLGIKIAHFRPQHVTARISRNVDRGIGR